MHDEYVEAARVLGDLDDPRFLATVDATKNPKLVEKYDIRKFPTILLVRNGIAVEYNGDLKTDGFVEYMKQRAGPVAATYASVAQLKKALEKSSVAIVGYFENNECEEYKRWEREVIALDTEHAVFINSPAVATEMGVQMPAVVLYYNGKDPVQVDARDGNIRQWMVLSGLPKIVPFTSFYSKLLFARDNTIRTHLLLFAPAEMPEELTTVLEAVATRFKGRLFVVSVNPELDSLFDYFGVDKESLPALMLVQVDDEMKKKALLKEDLTEENVTRFVEDFLEGRYKPYWKSEPAPEEPKEASLVRLAQGSDA